MKKKIILAFSGGLDTSAIIPWLIETYNAEVIACCCDLGNLPHHEELQAQALKLGASRFIFVDLKEEFVSQYVFPMCRANATYQQDYLLGTAIARPLIAKRIAMLAKSNGASAIAHGATGKGNDMLRFEKTWSYLNPEIEIIAPWREWQFKSRIELRDYLLSKVETFPFAQKSFYSSDSNIVHTSLEGSDLESIDSEYDIQSVIAQAGVGTATLSTSEDSKIAIEFKEGLPIRLNGKDHSPEALLSLLNHVGIQHNLGWVDLVEDRINGIKSRGIYISPGATILHFSLKQLKQICWGKGLSQLASGLSQHYGQLIYDGYWFSEARLSLESFFDRACQSLNGIIGLRIINGRIYVTKRQSPNSLYNRDHVSFENDQIGFNQASVGFSVFSNYSSRLAGMTKRGDS